MRTLLTGAGGGGGGSVAEATASVTTGGGGGAGGFGATAATSGAAGLGAGAAATGGGGGVSGGFAGFGGASVGGGGWVGRWRDGNGWGRRRLWWLGWFRWCFDGVGGLFHRSRRQILTDLEHRQANVFPLLGFRNQVDVGFVMGECFLLLAELMLLEGREVQVGGGKFRVGANALLEPMFGRREIMFASDDNTKTIERLGGFGVGLEVCLQCLLGLPPRGDPHVREAELVV